MEIGKHTQLLWNVVEKTARNRATKEGEELQTGDANITSRYRPPW